MAGYEPRTYREGAMARGLCGFEVKLGATDLQVWAERDLTREARAAATEARRQVEEHTLTRPEFLRTLDPLEATQDCPPVVAAMYAAAMVAGVGPMAAVAGTIAEYVGRKLLEHSDQVIVENGGDVFLASAIDRTIGVYAGGSPFSGRVGLRIPAERTPLGVCTSSATVGHSLSLGRADAACVVATDCALADAFATATCNRVCLDEDVEPTLEWTCGFDGILHTLVILGDRLGMKGVLELQPIRQ